MQKQTGIRYAMLEFVWLLKEAAVLTWSMGIGIKWVVMLFRLIVYGLFLSSGFLRGMWWYMNSSHILNRVFYRPHQAFAGHDNNRAYLDIHFPIPVSELLFSEGKRKFPVIVCVSGGAWII